MIDPDIPPAKKVNVDGDTPQPMTLTSFKGVDPAIIAEQAKKAREFTSGFTKKLLGGSVKKVVETFNKQTKFVKSMTEALKGSRARKLVNAVADSNELLQLFSHLPLDDIKASLKDRLKGAASSTGGKPTVRIELTFCYFRSF